MAERTYKKIDALTCDVTEVSTIKKTLNVDGVYNTKIILESQLAVINEAIAAMKAEGLDFTKHEPAE